MYPHPPPSRRPTNYYWILMGCVGLLLLFVFTGLRSVAERIQSAAAQAPLIAPAPSLSSRVQPTAVPQATATPSVAPVASASSELAATSGPLEVDAKALTESPGNYRSRLVRVRGTVFYTGKLADGKTWIQIVDSNNVYVDGQIAEPLPAGVTKGVQVELTGMGAGLTSVTAANGKDYDQAYIDPIQKIEIVR